VSRRRWQAFEDVYLRRYYRKLPMATLVSDLQRSRSAIYQRAKALGVVADRQCATEEQIRQALRTHHPAGWSDTEIAKALAEQLGWPVNRHRVGVVRRRMGLPTNRGSEHQRKRVAVKTAHQLRAAGLQSIGQLRVEAFNKWKRELGWPETLTIRAVQAVELFYERGPMTRLQLCAAMGIDKKARLKRTEPISNAKGGTVLAELQRAGLVMRLAKQVKSGRDRRGGVRKVDLYLLCPGVEPNDQRRTEIG
jgi:hypothetical protein